MSNLSFCSHSEKRWLFMKDIGCEKKNGEKKGEDCIGEGEKTSKGISLGIFF